MKQAYWMWHWGDYEIYHTWIMANRRQEFGADYPIFWNGSQPYPNVEFICEVDAQTPATVKLTTNGQGYIMVDNHRYAAGVTAEVPVGRHTIAIRVSKLGGLPCAYVESELCPSGAGWQATHSTTERFVADWLPVYDSVDVTPEYFPFAYETVHPVASETAVSEHGVPGVLYDFGKEMFGFIDVAGLDANVRAGIFYGESREEALADEEATVFEYVESKEIARLRQRAFRYIFVTGAPETLSVSAEFEYLPLEQRGSFRCDNEVFNRVWEMCRYTFFLNCRETYLDGIKRDRWPWSGDAYQSYLINRYLYQDRALDQRTSIGLRGKDPVEQNINTILDYSLNWMIALEENYLTFADAEYLKRLWKRACTLLDFVRTRENADGFLEGKNDWIFIDWSKIDKTGAVCAEQMLYIRALRAMAAVAQIIGEDGSAFAAQADALINRVTEFYWDAEKGAFIDSYASGLRNVTRHANIFALLFDIATPEQRESIIQNVLLSDQILKITTPYFEGFELDAMCQIGNFAFFEDMLTSYWGAMLDLGATTVWEEFDPTKTGVEHYAMYGNRFTKSLCHAWGATPVYLFGRYYLGVTPTAPGYKTFQVKPQLGGLGEIEGTAPVGAGEVYVHMTKASLTVRASVSGGTLIWKNQTINLVAGKTVTVE